MNEPLTYEDFISQVKEAGPSFSLKLNDEEYRTANENFQFKDIEIGKIYVFWDRQATWFLSPTQIESINEYSVYWCRYSAPATFSRKAIQCGAWRGHVWNGRRWKVLNTPPSFLNWNNLPWSDVK